MREAGKQRRGGERERTGAVASEATPAGEQVLVPGVTPVTLRERLALRLAAPLRARRPQKPLNVGLFDDDARNQLDLF